MEDFIPKVTALIIRSTEAGKQLLVFQHPKVKGAQLPAGTVEMGELPEKAVLREVFEETGLSEVRIVRHLGVQEMVVQEGKSVVLENGAPHLEPDATSPQAGRTIGRGWWVNILDRKDGWVKIAYHERDRTQTPPLLLWEVEGWVPEKRITRNVRRDFYRMELTAPTPDEWDQPGDLDYIFHLHWVALEPRPRLVDGQQAWLEMLKMD